MGKPLYLVSAHIKHQARRAAAQLDLEPDEWVYIPFERQARRIALEGRTVPDPWYLVGPFGEQERTDLVKPS
jgi:hypothetical protein